MHADDKSRDEMIEEARLLSASEPEEAFAILDDLLDEDPQDIEVLRLKGNILGMHGEPIEARRCHEAILSIDPNNARALLDVGDTYLEDTETSLEFYDRAIALLEEKGCPPSEEENEILEDAYWTKVLALRDAGRTDAAKECLRVALVRYPNSSKFKGIQFKDESRAAEDL
jgi:tetratricopeptide (TPR) repeat protein